MGAPADYLITAVWCHNNLQTVLLYSILRLLSHREREGDGNRNSVTANYRLKLLLQHHLTGFAPSRWLIFLLKHPQGRQTSSVPTQLRITAETSAEHAGRPGCKGRFPFSTFPLTFLQPASQPGCQHSCLIVVKNTLFTLIQDQLRTKANLNRNRLTCHIPDLVPGVPVHTLSTLCGAPEPHAEASVCRMRLYALLHTSSWADVVKKTE